MLDKLPGEYLNNYYDWFTVTVLFKSEESESVWDDWRRGEEIK